MTDRVRLVGLSAAILSIGLLLIACAVIWDQTVATQQKQDRQLQTVQTSIDDLQDPQRQIIDLPEDVRDCNVVVLVNRDWSSRPLDRKVVAWWAVPPLTSVRAQCHYKAYTAANPEYQSKYARAVPEAQLPAVLIQDGSGQVHWAVDKTTMPGSAQEMADSVGRLFKHRPWLPWRRHIEKDMNPEPVPPVPDADTSVKVDVGPVVPHPEEKPAPEPSNGSGLLVVLAIFAGIVGLVIGVLVSIRKRVSG